MRKEEWWLNLKLFHDFTADLTPFFFENRTVYFFVKMSSTEIPEAEFFKVLDTFRIEDFKPKYRLLIRANNECW